MLNLANHMISQGKRITGVVERAFVVRDHRIAYFFESLPEHRFFLAAKRRHFEQKTDAFEFFPDAFLSAGKLISRPADWCFVDELGILEADNKGLWPAISKVLAEKTTKMLVLGIRGDRLDIFAQKIAELQGI